MGWGGKLPPGPPPPPPPPVDETLAYQKLGSGSILVSPSLVPRFYLHIVTCTQPENATSTQKHAKPGTGLNSSQPYQRDGNYNKGAHLSFV